MSSQSNPEDRPNLLEMVGVVASTWSLVEVVIQGAIWILAKLPNQDTGRAITTHLSHPARLDMLMSLARLSDMAPERIEALDHLCAKLRGDLASRRNEVVHALWGDHAIGAVRSQLHKISARGKVHYKIATREAGDLAVLSVEIAEAGKLLMEIVDFKRAPESWRGLSPLQD